jgi:hypothetical protein
MTSAAMWGRRCGETGDSSPPSEQERDAGHQQLAGIGVFRIRRFSPWEVTRDLRQADENDTDCTDNADKRDMEPKASVGPPLLQTPPRQRLPLVQYSNS